MIFSSYFLYTINTLKQNNKIKQKKNKIITFYLQCIRIKKLTQGGLILIATSNINSIIEILLPLNFIFDFCNKKTVQLLL